ncbi:SRPBCC family protein [Kitasatospora sp. NPDC088391]|uniref:SRPBCC family protein n=1 Tax=Kitasatospora sp. NPDC088391 TaxID=3364074 RepID=UPI0038164230
MVTVQRSITVRRTAAEVLAYLADFGNAVEWDPGTESCARTDAGPIGVGSAWTNVSRFRGRRTTLRYTLERYEEHRLVFVGRNRTVTSTDDMVLHPFPDRTVLVYRAELRFHGPARLAAPFLRPAFERLADGVAERLPQALAEHP